MKMVKNEKVFKTDEDYYSDKEFISNSMLKDYLFCEHFFQVKHIDKSFVSPREGEPEYFIYGRAVDTILTEPEGTFEERFIAMETRVNIEQLKDLAIKETELLKEIREKAKENKAHKMLDTSLGKVRDKIKYIKSIGKRTQLSKGMMKDILQSVEELKRQPLYEMFGVKQRAQEVIALTIDGYKRKGKLDYIYPEKKIIADVKTTANIEKFDATTYAFQLAYYRDLAVAKCGIKAEEWDCYILAVDKATLFKRSEIYHLSSGLLNSAQIEIKAVLKEFSEKVKSGFFTPATKISGYYLARREKCFKCEHYPKCKFALQKDITHIG